eukprot:m.109052 g.109052  ORF g.109052 m.109052 type:complete len:300 (-) comp10686_c1_seq1:80-979(-)
MRSCALGVVGPRRGGTGMGTGRGAAAGLVDAVVVASSVESAVVLVSLLSVSMVASLACSVSMSSLLSLSSSLSLVSLGGWVADGPLPPCAVVVLAVARGTVSRTVARPLPCCMVDVTAIPARSSLSCCLSCCLAVSFEAMSVLLCSNDACSFVMALFATLSKRAPRCSFLALTARTRLSRLTCLAERRFFSGGSSFFLRLLCPSAGNTSALESLAPDASYARSSWLVSTIAAPPFTAALVAPSSSRICVGAIALRFRFRLTGGAGILRDFTLSQPMHTHARTHVVWGCRRTYVPTELRD